MSPLFRLASFPSVILYSIIAGSRISAGNLVILLTLYPRKCSPRQGVGHIPVECAQVFVNTHSYYWRKLYNLRLSFLENFYWRLGILPVGDNTLQFTYFCEACMNSDFFCSKSSLAHFSKQGRSISVNVTATCNFNCKCYTFICYFIENFSWDYLTVGVRC